jgi:outer membrane biosynthesis protein TonB
MTGEGMKTSLVVSGVAHAAVLLWGIVAFAARPLDKMPTESLPVDIISATEFTQMTAGVKTAKKVEAPKPLVEKIAEAKPTEDLTKVTAKQEVQATQAAEPPPPPPKPEPKKPEPEPKKAEKVEKPEPKKPEPKPDQIAEALKKEEAKPPKKVEPPKPEQQKPEPPKPVAEKKPPTPPQPKFDAQKVAALLDKRAPQRLAAAGEVMNTTASLGTARGSAAQLSQSELDALRARLQQCWSLPAGAADAKDLSVLVVIRLRQDGSLQSEPMVTNRGSSPFFQVAAESALRAVRRCAPFSFLPVAKYDVWKEVEVNFDPRDMFRG